MISSASPASVSDPALREPESANESTVHTAAPPKKISTPARDVVSVIAAPRTSTAATQNHALF